MWPSRHSGWSDSARRKSIETRRKNALANNHANAAMMVKDIIGKHLGVAVKDDSHIANDLGADSLDQIEIVMALENAFGIEIPDVHAERIKTVGQAVNYVKGRLSK